MHGSNQKQMTAPYVDFEQLAVGEHLPPLPFSLSPEQIEAFLDATGEPPSQWRSLVPPHCLFAHAMAEVTRAMPLPASAVHAGTELTMQAPASCADSYVVRVELTRRRANQGSVVSHFGLAIATARGAPTLTGSITLVNDELDGGE